MPRAAACCCPWRRLFATPYQSSNATIDDAWIMLSRATRAGIGNARWPHCRWSTRCTRSYPGPSLDIYHQTSIDQSTVLLPGRPLAERSATSNEEKQHLRHQDVAGVVDQLNRRRADLPRDHTGDRFLLLMPLVRAQQAAADVSPRPNPVAAHVTRPSGRCRSSNDGCSARTAAPSLAGLLTE
jgi:hypothetical protein